MRFNTTAFADGNCAWRSEAFRLGLRFEPACHQQKVFVRNIHDHMDAGTQVLDPSWLELKRFLGNKFPVSQSVSKWQATEGLIQLYLTLSFNLSTDSRRCLPHTKQVLFSIEKIAESHATFQRSEGKTVDLQTLTGGTCKNAQFLCEKKPCPIPPMTANSEI